MAVGVDADGIFDLLFLQLLCDPDEVIQPAGGLAEAAEDNFVKDGQLPGENLRKNVLLCRLLALIPKGIRLGHMIGGVADAEIAVAGAYVGEIDIEIVTQNIGSGHGDPPGQVYNYLIYIITYIRI